MEKSKITLSTGQLVDVWTVRGVVADDQHSTSTQVHSRGGGGYVGPHGGYVAAAQVHSETTTRQIVWITDDKHKDHEVVMQNTYIRLRVGQRVTARFVMPPGAHQARLETFTNHSAELFYTWTDRREPPIDVVATDRGSLRATAFFVGGCATCWYAYRQVDGPARGDLLWFWVGVLLLGGLAALTGVVMRTTRRANLRKVLRAEYVQAFHALK